MADAEDVRRLAPALPHAEEIGCGGLDFPVGAQGFVWPAPEGRPGRPGVTRTDSAVWLAGEEAEKQALLLGAPKMFSTTPGYAGWPLVMPRRAEVARERRGELVVDAGRMRPPAAIA